MDRKRKRNSGGNEADWTAARCQRLLRPISSRIAPLRNLAYITDSYRPEKNLPKPDVASRTSGARLSESGGLSEDPAWLRRSDTKPHHKSYSSKDRVKKQESASSSSKLSKPDIAVSQDGLVSLPTPFRARALRRGTPIKNGAENFMSTPCAKAKVRPTKRVKKDPFSFAPVAMQSAELHDRQTFEKVFELHQGIVDGYSLLLQKTDHKPVPQSNRGARSLFSACLRRVPDYIQAEEDWRKSIDPDDETDVAAEVYEELEGLGSTLNHGWPPLRQVVRAHGTKLVHDAVRSKLVSSKTRAELANIALRHGEMVDTERLVIAFAHTLPLKRPFDETSPLFDGCLSNLSDTDLANDHTSSAMTRIRILDSLFQSGKLHATWIATKDVAVVISQAVRSLASIGVPEDITQITHFLETVVNHLLDSQLIPGLQGGKRTIDTEELASNSGVSQSLIDRAHETLHSLFTVLTAMAIIPTRQNSEENDFQLDSSQIAAALLQRLATSILLKSTQTNQEEQSGYEANFTARIKLDILASSLIMAFECDSGPGSTNIDMNDLIRGIDLISKHCNIAITPTKEIASFICHLALCCGQSLRFDAQNILEDLVRNLVSDSEAKTSCDQTFLRQLALESAFEFEHLRPTDGARAFAREMEQIMRQHVQLPGVRLAKRQIRMQETKAHSSFRWEEGLCEWIAATPLPSRKQNYVKPSHLPTSPIPALPGLPRDNHIDEYESRISSDDSRELHDSAYSSVHETPKFVRRAPKAQVLMSSPDVLADEPRLMAGFSRPPRPLRFLTEPQKSRAVKVTEFAEKTRTSAGPSQLMSFAIREDPGPSGSDLSAQSNPSKVQPGSDVYPSVSASSALSRQADDKMQRACRPAKSQSLEDQPIALSQIASTPSRSPICLAPGDASSNNDLENPDELALSCKKTRPLVESSAPTVKNRVARSTLHTLDRDLTLESMSGGSRKRAVEESEDELG